MLTGLPDSRQHRLNTSSKSQKHRRRASSGVSGQLSFDDLFDDLKIVEFKTGDKKSKGGEHRLMVNLLWICFNGKFKDSDDKFMNSCDGHP
jgi:hypothetical protein